MEKKERKRGGENEVFAWLVQNFHFVRGRGAPPLIVERRRSSSNICRDLKKSLTRAAKGGIIPLQVYRRGMARARVARHSPSSYLSTEQMLWVRSSVGQKGFPKGKPFSFAWVRITTARSPAAGTCAPPAGDGRGRAFALQRTSRSAEPGRPVSLADLCRAGARCAPWERSAVQIRAPVCNPWSRSATSRQRGENNRGSRGGTPLSA